MDNKNHLGLDKFQLTIIKSNYASIKPSLSKRNKAMQKMEELQRKYAEKMEAAMTVLKQEVAAYEEQIAMIDKFTEDTTKKSCGIGLTTEQCMAFLDNPEAFEDYKKSIGMSDSLFETNTDGNLTEEKTIDNK